MDEICAREQIESHLVTVPFRQVRENEVSKWQRVRQCAYLGHARALRMTNVRQGQAHVLFYKVTCAMRRVCEANLTSLYREDKQ